jgi:hypothetical protein
MYGHHLIYSQVMAETSLFIPGLERPAPRLNGRGVVRSVSIPM